MISPYAAFVIENNKVVSRGCWKRSNNSKESWVIFVEKVNKNRYEYNKIDSGHFK